MRLKHFDWDFDDRYQSNKGHGPLTARIISITAKGVLLERWRRENGKRTRFTLSLSYFTSPACGWKKQYES